ncbi:hypothetical protein IJH23_03320 [Candidatus Saccharibacteria bacterium]|nr:hypothetical protein [Candidatus Saccharibacteria bacterium]
MSSVTIESPVARASFCIRTNQLNNSPKVPNKTIKAKPYKPAFFILALILKWLILFTSVFLNLWIFALLDNITPIPKTKAKIIIAIAMKKPFNEACPLVKLFFSPVKLPVSGAVVVISPVALPSFEDASEIITLRILLTKFSPIII